MRKEATAAVIAILVVASLGVGYLAGGSQTKFATSTTTVVSSATVDRTVTSTLTVGVPINASDIESGYATIRGQPEYFAVNPNDNVVYVASPFSDNLTTFELLPFSGPYITTLPYSSNGIAIDPSTNIVYVGVANITAAGLAEVNTSVASSGGAGNGEPGKTGSITNEVVRVLPAQLYGPLAMDSSTHVIYGIALGPRLEGVDVLTGAVVVNVSLGYPSGQHRGGPGDGHGLCRRVHDAPGM